LEHSGFRAKPEPQSGSRVDACAVRGGQVGFC
jgi:hypothetical protein